MYASLCSLWRSSWQNSQRFGECNKPVCITVTKHTCSRARACVSVMPARMSVTSGPTWALGHNWEVCSRGSTEENIIIADVLCVIRNTHVKNKKTYFPVTFWVRILRYTDGSMPRVRVFMKQSEKKKEEKTTTT